MRSYAEAGELLMWLIVFVAAAFFAVTFAVVSYSMREARRGERRRLRMLGDPHRHPAAEFALFLLFMAVGTGVGVAAIQNVMHEEGAFEISNQTRDEK